MDLSDISIRPAEEALPMTGFSHIDQRGISEAPSAATNAALWSPLKDPVDTRLVSSTRATAVQGGQPVESEVEFFTIANAYNVDSYIRTAIDKYNNIVGKEGWRITGVNQQAIDYIKLRLRTLLFTCKSDFIKILADIKFNLILFGNVFLIKVPFKGSNPIPKLKLQPIKGFTQIGGLFIIHPTLLQPVYDDKGVLKEWRYIVNGSERGKFKPEDVIHIAYNRHPNTVYGQPYFLPVLEDVRTYRQLEWLTVMLLNRYIHPLIHARKGVSVDGKFTNVSDEALNKLEAAMRNMSADGILVTGGDVELQFFGAESHAIRAEGYLEAWRKGRIYSGLRVSDLVMGEATNGTRSTGDTVTAEMHDMATAFQNIIEHAINTDIVIPILLEGGFDVLAEDNSAIFEFNPVSLEEALQRNNDIQQLWLNDMITEDEMREGIRRTPISDADREKTHSNLYPDQPTTVAAGGQTVATPKAAGSQNKATPTNQKGTKSSPGGNVTKK